jgi:sulfate-transporting ATPase
VTIGSTRVVDEVSLTVEPGRITGLMGANGAGKTTLIDAITGFHRTAGGRILLDGHDVGHAAARSRADAGMGRCFQSVELFEDMTVREHLLVATERVPASGWVTALVRPGRSRLDPATEALAALLELDTLLDRYPRELPHGRRRLVGVARALAARPSVLLLDEPAAGLDPVETRELGALLRRVAREWGIGVLLVEHDVGLVTDVSDEVVAIDFGRLIFTGAPSDALADPTVRAAYLGTHDPRVNAPLAAGVAIGAAADAGGGPQ